MKNIRRTIFLILLSLVCSCTSDFYEISNVIDDDSLKVTAILQDWDLEDIKTRTSITTGPYPTLPSPVWVTGDSIGIYPNAGGDQLSFRINEGGSKTCTFDGGGWAMTSASYTAYSPFRRSYYYEKKDALPISMLGQTQDGNDNPDHLGAYDIQIATGEKPETGSLIFSFSRKVALVRLEITAPKAATWTSISLESDALFTTDAIMNLDLETPAVTPVTTSNSVTLNLKNVSTTRDNLSIIAYMMLLPVDLTGKTLSVKLSDSEGNIYSKGASVTNNKTNFAANAARWVTADFEKIIPNNEIWYTSTDGSIITPHATNAFGTTIKSNTYENGKGIIIFENDITTIGSSAFYHCSLKSVTLPNSVIKIGEKAFYGCASLTSIAIPNSVTNIEMDTFGYCSSMTSIIIPKSVTSIGAGLFKGCESLISIIVEDGNTIYDSRDNCNAIIETASNTLISGCKNTIIPHGITKIGVSAFLANSLTSMTIPNSVVEIGYYSFGHCSSLSSITIPNSITKIGDSAFGDCISLSTIYVKSTNPPTIEDPVETFKNCSKNLKVYVPEESITIYKSATGWKDLNIFPDN